MSPATFTRRAATEAVARARLAMDGHQATIRGLVPDAAGRFRAVAAWAGCGPPCSDGVGTALRRAAFERRADLIVDLPRRENGRRLALGAFPLVAEDQPVGILEVMAAPAPLAKHRPLLAALALDTSELVQAKDDRERQERAIEGMGILFHLTAEILRSDRRAAAVRVAAEACRRYFEAPAAGLLPDRSGSGWYVACLRGAGRGRLQAARAAAAVAPTRGPRAEILGELSASIGAAAGLGRVQPIDADPAVLLVRAPVRQDGPFATSVAFVLGHALRYQETVRLARDRNERFDLGIAWTAHELRGPIAAARHALEHAMRDPSDPETVDLLSMVRAELEYVESIVHPLLRWSAGERSLQRERVDLVALVRAAAIESILEAEDDRIRTRMPASVPVDGDELQLRSAVTNVLRNALAYSPRDTPVEVDVLERDGIATIAVRDRGPGVAAPDRDRIFDPLARGAATSSTRGGRGLGLYIARRVLEAHGGTIRILPTPRGSLFVLELPIRPEEAPPSPAS
jgi:signal transduction histidine kinase